MSENLWLEIRSDEYADGYIARMAELNFRRGENFWLQIQEPLIDYIEKKIGKPKSLLLGENFSKHLGGILQWRSLGYVNSEPDNKSLVRKARGKVRTIHRPTLCRSCFLDQESELGYSYWSRDLMLGIYSNCPIHKEPLICGPLQDVRTVPTDVLLNKRFARHPYAENYADFEFNHETVIAYIQFALELTNGIVASTKVDLEKFISEALDEVGWCDQTLMRELNDRYPRDWLYLEFEQLQANKSLRADGRAKILDFYGGYGVALILAILPATVQNDFLDIWRMPKLRL